MVLNSSALFAGLGLGPEWERPTVELSALRRRGSSHGLKQAFRRSLGSAQAIGAAVVAGLTVGIAVLVFGAGTKPAPQLTASGSMQPVDQGPVEPPAQVGAEPGGMSLADIKPAPTIVGNPALGLAPNATENLKLHPLKDTKKAKKAPNPRAAADPGAVRLPPSGL